MNRPLTALFAALEALLVVGIGIGIPLVPLTIMWAAQYGLQIDWLVFWRASVDIWLLGSGADIRMTLDPAVATAAGFVGAETPFVLTIAPLGFALLTVLLGVRAGRRVAETPYPDLRAPRLDRHVRRAGLRRDALARCTRSPGPRSRRAR